MQRAQLALTIALVAAVSALVVSLVRSRAELRSQLDKVQLRADQNGTAIAALRSELSRRARAAAARAVPRVTKAGSSTPAPTSVPISPLQFVARWNREMAARAAKLCWTPLAPKGEPVIVFRARVSATGIIQSARPIGIPVKPELAACVLRLLKTMRLPKSLDGKPYSVTLQTQRPNAFTTPGKANKR